MPSNPRRNTSLAFATDVPIGARKEVHPLRRAVAHKPPPLMCDHPIDHFLVECRLGHEARAPSLQLSSGIVGRATAGEDCSDFSCEAAHIRHKALNLSGRIDSLIDRYWSPSGGHKEGWLIPLGAVVRSTDHPSHSGIKRLETGDRSPADLSDALCDLQVRAGAEPLHDIQPQLDHGLGPLVKIHGDEAAFRVDMLLGTNNEKSMISDLRAVDEVPLDPDRTAKGIDVVEKTNLEVTKEVQVRVLGADLATSLAVVRVWSEVDFEGCEAMRRVIIWEEAAPGITSIDEGMLNSVIGAVDDVLVEMGNRCRYASKLLGGHWHREGGVLGGHSVEIGVFNGWLGICRMGRLLNEVLDPWEFRVCRPISQRTRQRLSKDVADGKKEDKAKKEKKEKKVKEKKEKKNNLCS